MSNRTALQRMAAQAFPDDERLLRMVPEAERARRLHRILDRSRLHSVPEPASRGRRWAPVLVVGVVVVAVLVVVAVFVLPGSVGDRQLTGPAVQPPPAPVATTEPADLATTLPELAERAAAQPPLADEPYDYVHLRGIYPTRFEQPDGSVTIGDDEVRDQARWTGDNGVARSVGVLTSRGGEEHEWGAMDEPARLDLPTDPGALEGLLTSRVWNPLRKPTLYFAMEGLWSTQVVEPPAQAALLRLLASKPDVHVVGPTTDRLGRPGLAVAVTETGEIRGDAVDKRRAVIEHTLVFDQRTGALLAFEAVQLEGGETPGPRPLSRGYEMVLKATRVGSIEERP
jgi:hypothetical protein